MIISITSQIFDPLGLLSPVLIKAKLIMKKLWKLNISWHESIPLDSFKEWRYFYENVKSLNN